MYTIILLYLECCFISATLTSRGVLSGIYFLLVHFQNVQKKISDEILEVIGTERQPIPRDMHQMPYTHACILEALRYQSHLGITATHTNTTSDFVIDGLHVPRGSSVSCYALYQLWAELISSYEAQFYSKNDIYVLIQRNKPSAPFWNFSTINGRDCRYAIKQHKTCSTSSNQYKTDTYHSHST